MFTIGLRSNVDAVARRLDWKAKEQVPFATAMALNDTAFKVRNHLVEVTFPRDFELRNKRWPGVALRVTKASKRNLTAAVFDRLARGSLLLHAKGGTKYPRSRNLAIPVNVNRGSSGGIPASRRPRGLMGNRNVFVADLRGKGLAIWQRVGGRRRKELKLLYALTPRAPIKRDLSFYEDAAAVALKEFDPAFRAALARALATAR